MNGVGGGHYGAIDQRRRRQRAFTLVELMIAIALSLILLIGINAVFRMSGDTVGTGQQMLELQRQFRTFRDVIGNDADRMADFQTTPGLIIESLNTPAFKDRYDQQAATGNGVVQAYNPNDTTAANIALEHAAIMEPLDPQTPGQTIYSQRSSSTTVFPAWSGLTAGGAKYQAALAQIISQRNHRTDLLSFFARNPDLYRRQTPPDVKQSSSNNLFQSGYLGTEAWITYGHVLQPDNNELTSGKHYVYDPATQVHYQGLGASIDPNNPGTLYTPSNNPNNIYASQWILGRMPIQLGDPARFFSYVNPDSGLTESQCYVGDPTYGFDPGQTGNFGAIQPLYPLAWGSKVYAPALNPTTAAPLNPVIRIQHSQCDLAGESMAAIRERFLHAEYDTSANFYPRWYYPLVSRGYGNNDTQTNVNPWPRDTSFTTGTGKFGPEQAYRFFCKPWPDKTISAASPQMTKQEMSLQVPAVLRGCSQFIVEYAGDYVRQQDTVTTGGPAVPPGTITDIAEDGQLDFDVVTIPGQTPGAPGTIVKRIRWYGMTRSLDNGQTVEDTTLAMPTSQAGAGRPPKYPQMVRPLYRYIQQAIANNLIDPAGQQVPTINALPFEKIVGGGIFTGFPDKRPSNYIDSYTCAWGPAEINLDDMPKQTGGQWYTILSNKKKFPSRSLLPWMIRVTVRLDDPNNRLADGQTMEFIFNVKRPHNVQAPSTTTP